jgi:large subunit ribosomal protein L6|tara:strand:+ start:230 stop:763 length:534 start_codon:yes stop_codon:yes gene_type:complete
MSRIGKKPIAIPDGTEVSFNDGILNVKGPNGELEREFKSDIKIEIKDKKVVLSRAKENNFTQALWGTYASHVSNMISGVNTPFKKKLVVEGIGFKSSVEGDKLVMNLGFSHLVEFEIPKDLKVTAEKNVITVSGIDKEKVGQFASKIRSRKKPEPYKGKGIRYEGEVIRRKQGKKAA